MQFGDLPSVHTAVKLVGNLALKLEGHQPSGSVKYRLSHYILSTALVSGRLQKGQPIVEVSSGNTGIALAFLAKHTGSKARIILPDSASRDIVNKIIGFGSEPVILPIARGLDYAFARAREIQASGAYWPDQFHNQFPEAYFSLADEMLECVHSDCIVVPVGTGSTLSGLATRLRNKQSTVSVIAVETTVQDPVDGLRDEASHYQDDAYNPAAASTIIRVGKQQALSCLDELAKQGIKSSSSTGAAVWAAKSLGKNRIAVVCPDARCEDG